MFKIQELKTIFFDKQSIYLFVLFFLLKITSFYLMNFPAIQALIVFVLIFLLGILFFKNPYFALSLILIEFLFGGSGHYFEFFGLSIRTVLTLIFCFLWFAYSFASKKDLVKLKIKNNLFYFLVILVCLVIFSFLVGFKNGHDIKNIIADFIPYTIFAFVLAFENYFSDKRFKHFFIRLMIVFIIGSAIFALFNFIFFRLGIFEIHDDYYKWIRDVLGGKITYITSYFYRIVLPEHLLIAPISLFIASLLMRDEKHHKMWRILFILAMIILVLNFSRAYFMGLFFGFLILKYKHKISRYLKVSFWSLAIFILCFSGTIFLSSAGKSFGLELIGFRLESMIMPEIETSANTRMLKLDPILNLIKNNSILGVGLGATITYIDPVTYKNIKDIHFDWGYLEMIAELGIITTLLFLIFYLLLTFEIIKKINTLSDYHDMYIGLLAGIISLLAINITTPVLFHTLGIFYLSLVFIFIIKPVRFYDEIISIVYNIFNKKSINQ